jgi:hypothetical protein
MFGSTSRLTPGIARGGNYVSPCRGTSPFLFFASRESRRLRGREFANRLRSRLSFSVSADGLMGDAVLGGDGAQRGAGAVLALDLFPVELWFGGNGIHNTSPLRQKGAVLSAVLCRNLLESVDFGYYIRVVGADRAATTAVSLEMEPSESCPGVLHFTHRVALSSFSGRHYRRTRRRWQTSKLGQH